MNECTLHNLLTSCQYPQVFWIYQMNDYDENILLTKGTKQEMLEDDENSFDLIDHINDVVEYWTIREDGAMFVRIRMDDRAKELFSEDYVKKWDRFNPLKRPYLYTAELDDFTNCIYGSSEYLHPYGDPLDCHHWDEQTETSTNGEKLQSGVELKQTDMAEDIVESFGFNAESYRQAKAKTEPQYDADKLTIKCDNCSENGSYKCSKCDGEMYFKRLEVEDEPQTERSE